MPAQRRERIVFGTLVAAFAAVLTVVALAATTTPTRPSLTGVEPAPELAAAPAAAAEAPAAAAPVAAAPVLPAAEPTEPATAGIAAELAELHRRPAQPAPVVAAPQEATVDVAAPAAPPAGDETLADTAPEPEPDVANTGPDDDRVEVENHVSVIPEPPVPGASDTPMTFEIERPEDPDDPWAGVRRCESHNNYSINTGNSFYGAYQFTISTWNWVAEIIDRTDLIGLRPDLATPADQDRMAQALGFEVAGGGLGHWPVCGRYYG